MEDWTVAALADAYCAGRLSRRRFVALLLGAGLTLPLISLVLAGCSSKSSPQRTAASTEGTARVASPTAVAAFTPTRRGGGGTLKLLWWQAPTVLIPAFAGGSKDTSAARMFLEPLADYGPDGSLVPILASEIPSIAKGTLDPGGTFVVWKLKPGVTWHDGTPFTAGDVTFLYEWLSDPDTAGGLPSTYQRIQAMERVDDLTVRVTFKQPTLLWDSVLVGDLLLPRHVFEPFKGKAARNAPVNLKQIGTGPYIMREFRPGDAILANINPNYHVANRPFFDAVELKGGGDAVGAARAVLETGEYDFAWNLLVDSTQLASLEKNGVGTVYTVTSGDLELIEFNETDPSIETDGEVSSLKNPHPFLTDQRVRRALMLAIDRQTIVEQLYGKTGGVVSYFAYTPQQYVPAAGYQFDPGQANQLLDAAGWVRGNDGVRSRNGERLHLLYTTSVNAVRQSEQTIVKQNLAAVGVELELKAVDPTVFFGSGDSSPDSGVRFPSDLETVNQPTSGPSEPFLPMSRWLSTAIPQKANGWSGGNISRYQNPAFDALYHQVEQELDPVKAVDLYKQLNQLLLDDAAFVPLVARYGAMGAKKNLHGLNLSGWATVLWWLPYWYRTA